MKIHFLGGARTVTGTCFYAETPETHLLVDCGMVQGEDSDILNRAPFAFSPEKIDRLFLTHAHIDHSGLLPRLVREGFQGKIITTPATADLVATMLADSAHIQTADAQWRTRKALRSGKEPVFPLYTIADVEAMLPLLTRVPYGKIGGVGKAIRYRYLDAGHILGSGSLEVWFQDNSREKKIVFSGDIGKKGNPIIHDPSPPGEADYVVMESTYGDRLHKSLTDTIEELAGAIERTFHQGGNIIIPAFAIGRTQDVLYVLNRLVLEGRLAPIDVYLDSPLAEEATKTYLAHPELFDEEARQLLHDAGRARVINLRFAHSPEESMQLNRIKSHAVIIAGSGMCEGGRIRHHLKHNLWRPECGIVFVGFQAAGTLGRSIVDRAKSVDVLGEQIAVKARIYTLGGFSAHADQRELLEWVSSFKNAPRVFVVHGEEKTSQVFSEIVSNRLGFTVSVPAKGQTFEL